ncbi:MAG: hypothetical protein GDA46_06305 [Bdellovibrionales bacterium]|nr:hypothetical protein [Bdellovibrionales bacterium]
MFNLSLFYHGKESFKWKGSLQEEDFKSFLIPRELRKNMLNYKPRVISTKDKRRGKEVKMVWSYKVIR